MRCTSRTVLIVTTHAGRLACQARGVVYTRELHRDWRWQFGPAADVVHKPQRPGPSNVTPLKRA